MSKNDKRGLGWGFCRRCFGFQQYADTNSLKRDEKKAILDVVGTVRDLRVLRGALPTVVHRVEEVFLRLDRSSTLDYFRSMKPEYKRARGVRNALGAVPLPAQASKQAVDEWRQARTDVRNCANFLISYGIEYSRWLRNFEMLRKSRKTVDFRMPPAARAMVGAVTPDVLSAFPDQDPSGWIAVTAYFEGYSEGETERGGQKNKKGKGVEGPEPMRGRIILQSDLPHNVNFFNWLPAAAEPLKKLGAGHWASRVSNLGSTYPFQIREALSKTPKGRRVILAGRFLRDRLGYPRNWFEVWDIHVGFTREEEALHAELAEPILWSVNPSIKASDFTRNHVLPVYGVEVTWPEAMGEALLELSIENSPVGLALDEMARALGLEWDFEPGKARMGHAPARALSRVLAELRERSQAKMVARRAPGGHQAASAELPADMAGLQMMAEKASGSMNYRLAARCWERLVSMSSDEAERARRKRALARNVLLHDLSGATSQSALVGAGDLARIRIRNPQGDESVQIVRILGEKDRELEYMDAYGSKSRIKNDIKPEVVTAAAWRREKEAEMTARLSKLEEAKAGPREDTGERFLLAHFAKMYGFPDKGASLLDRALQSDEFPWLVSVYFPDASRRMVESWNDVTGRKDAAPPQPEGPPAVVSALSPTEELPESTGELLPYARKHRGQAMAYLRQSLPGTQPAGDLQPAGEKMKLASEHLRAAQAALEKLALAGDLNPAARSLSREVAEMLQICTRGMGLFD